MSDPIKIANRKILVCYLGVLIVALILYFATCAPLCFVAGQRALSLQDTAERFSRQPRFGTVASAAQDVRHCGEISIADW